MDMHSNQERCVRIAPREYSSQSEYPAELFRSRVRISLRLVIVLRRLFSRYFINRARFHEVIFDGVVEALLVHLQERVTKWKNVSGRCCWLHPNRLCER